MTLPQTWTCTVPGAPVAWSRPRFQRTSTGKLHSFTAPKSARWATDAVDRFALSWRGRAPLDCPVGMSVLALFPRPAGKVCRHKRACSCDRERLPHTSKPDLDNCIKAVGDALVAAGVLRDDCRVVRVVATKSVAAESEGPRVEVSLTWEEA